MSPSSGDVIAGARDDDYRFRVREKTLDCPNWITQNQNTKKLPAATRAKRACADLLYVLTHILLMLPINPRAQFHNLRMLLRTNNEI